MSISKKTREQVYEKYNVCCAYCGRKQYKDMSEKERAVIDDFQDGGYWSVTQHQIEGKRVFVIGVK